MRGQDRRFTRCFLEAGWHLGYAGQSVAKTGRGECARGPEARHAERC